MSDSAWVDCGDGVRLERGARCRMSDGAELVSDHSYPPGGGPHPTLLMRQPDGRDIASTVVYAHPIWFARHGYNVVIQDVRGRGDSEGEFYPFRHEARDGSETIAWLRTRPESNGRIGMYGFSYQGITQLLAAAEQPEGLVCIAPGMTACDLYHGWFYHNGALRLACPGLLADYPCIEPRRPWAARYRSPGRRARQISPIGIISRTSMDAPGMLRCG